MNKPLITLALSLWTYLCFSQTTQLPIPHIKIVLVGTFHFGSTGDRNSTAFPDLFSRERQTQLQDFTTQLAHLKPDKIFVENEPDRQAYWDSVLTLYQQKHFDSTSTRNEIFQVGIRIATKAGLKEVICVDHQQDWPFEKVQAFDKKAETDSVIHKKVASYKLLNYPYPYPKQTQKLATSSLLAYYLYINSAPAEAANRSEYFVYFPASGYDNDYTGTEMITNWYDRNAKIFTNILRKAEPTDKLYILLIGTGHLLPLRHYFQSCPYFEVLELGSVLKP